MRKFQLTLDLYFQISSSYILFSIFLSLIVWYRDLCSGGRDWWRPVWLCWRWIWIRVRMLLLQYNCCGWRPHIHNVLWEHNNSYQRRKHCLMIWWILTNRTRIPILCCCSAAYRRDASKSSNYIFGNLRTRVKTALDIDQFALFNCEAMIIMCRYLHNVPITLLTAHEVLQVFYKHRTSLSITLPLHFNKCQSKCRNTLRK